VIVTREDGVAAGIDVARLTFREAEPRLKFRPLAQDGDRLRAGAALAQVTGEVGGILKAERTALNFLQRMCGVASLTRRFVDAIAGTGAVILDTRKTTPGLRYLEKYAVKCGGGENHRFALWDMYLIKDNHIRAAGGAEALIRHLERAPRPPFIEVEVDSPAFLRAMLGRPVDRIMLDNFSPAMVADALADVRSFQAGNPGWRVEIEVSGGVTLETVRDYALPGVDFISVGALTHSAPAATMSLEVL
jgi:nicotinate-nucleotide pyrophosphorylase (carboxylating)